MPRRPWLRPRASAGSPAATWAWRVEACACSPVRAATTRTASSLRFCGLGDSVARRDPAQMEQQRFGAAHLAGNVAVAHRLPRLGLQRRDLGGELADDVFEPRQILLGGLEPQLRLVAARMQPGNAGRLFEHAPALVGPRLDDLADAALMHQSGRPRAGRGVGEQHGDVARAHFAAVDAEGRALLAHDAARHFERIEFVEGGGRLAIAVVDRDRDFGVVAPRALGIAGEDDVVHLRRRASPCRRLRP